MMWARVVELMLGCWLLVSPFIFRGSGTEAHGWWIDRAAGCAVVALSALSFWRPMRRSHIATGILAVCLVAWTWVTAARPGPPAAQNDIVVGLLLLMLSIVPNEASSPPESWRAK